MVSSAAVDYAPLTRHPSSDEIDSVRREAKAGVFGKKTAEEVRGAKGTLRIVALIIGGFITLIFAITTLVEWIQGDDVLVGVIVTGFVAFVCYLLYLVGRLAGRRSWRHSVQLINFARANGLKVQVRAKRPSLPSDIFSPRHQYPITRDWIAWTQSGQQCEVAIQQWWSQGSGTTEVRFLAVQLDAELPRMSFGCGRSIGGLADLSVGEDVLADEPGLPKRHRPQLMCGAADERRARALFTDELIGLLADDDHPADAEVSGHWFIAYFRDANSLDEQLWRHTFAAADLVVRNDAALQRQQR